MPQFVERSTNVHRLALILRVGTGHGGAPLLSKHSGDGVHSRLRLKARLRFTSPYLKQISRQQ